MEVVLTGTGSPLPDANRAGPSTLVTAGDTHILVDAGRGVVMRMAGAGSLPVFLSAVLVTHLHSDHICDLNDVITTHWVMGQGSATLRIYGPAGTTRFVERQMHALEDDIGYRIAHHDVLTSGPLLDVVELTAGQDFLVNDVQVFTAATEHAPVRPTLGYRLEHEGSVAALVGDTIPCEGVDALAAAADVYVQTVIRRDLVQLHPNEMFRDILDYHSGVIEAAQTAARVGAKRLALTHMVPAPTPDEYPDWVGRASEHFDGEIIIGDDLTTIGI
jgi:ribonuclease Z